MARTPDPKLTRKLTELEQRAEELSRELADPAIVSDRERYRSTGRAYAELEPIVTRFREYQRVGADLAGARELQGSDDEEMRAMVGEEIDALEQRLEELEQELRLALLPSDPDETKNVILEIRAGTGGDEATLFAAEIFRMYSRFAERQRWKVRTTDLSESAQVQAFTPSRL